MYTFLVPKILYSIQVYKLKIYLNVQKKCNNSSTVCTIFLFSLSDKNA